MRRIDWALPVAGAGALTVIGVVEIVLDPQFRAAPVAPSLVLMVVLAGMLLSIWAPVWGTALAATQFVFAAALGLNGPTGAGVLAFLLLPGWAGWRRPVRRSWLAPLAAQGLATAGAAVGAAMGGASVTDRMIMSTGDSLAAIVWENLYFSAIAWVSWMVGAFARGAGDRAVRAERLAAALDAEREARERAILVEERQRIARDLHDSVAHSVSVMTLQVGALRATLPPGSTQAELLQGIERLGRESVAELRTAVGILRSAEPGEAAPPSLARAAELVDEVRAAGVDVTLVTEGEPRPLARSIDVPAFRVLQESLSNVLRHAAPGSSATVRLAWSPGELVLEVTNPDAAARPPSPGLGSYVPTEDAAGANGGHGLVGMRERLAMVGGIFEAGQVGGAWRVRAVFPLDQTTGDAVATGSRGAAGPEGTR